MRVETISKILLANDLEKYIVKPIVTDLDIVFNSICL